MVEESDSTLASGSTGKYKEAVVKLESWGFTNVKAVPLEDLLTITAFVADGLVEDITINGRTFTAGDCFEKDAAVIITFHSQRGADGYSSSDN